MCDRTGGVNLCHPTSIPRQLVAWHGRIMSSPNETSSEHDDPGRMSLVMGIIFIVLGIVFLALPSSPDRRGVHMLLGIVNIAVGGIKLFRGINR